MGQLPEEIPPQRWLGGKRGGTWPCRGRGRGAEGRGNMRCGYRTRRFTNQVFRFTNYGMVKRGFTNRSISEYTTELEIPLTNSGLTSAVKRPPWAAGPPGGSPGAPHHPPPWHLPPFSSLRSPRAMAQPFCDHALEAHHWRCGLPNSHGCTCLSSRYTHHCGRYRPCIAHSDAGSCKCRTQRTCFGCGGERFCSYRLFRALSTAPRSVPAGEET